MILKRIKQYVIVAALLGVVIFVIFTLWRSDSLITSNDTAHSLDALESKSSVSYSFILDDDDDSLSNAEEYLYGSDPVRPDSDSDGYMDGVEIDNGYDPINPGSSESARLAARPDKNITVRYLVWVRDKTAQQRPKIDKALVEQFLSETNSYNFAVPAVPERELRLVASSPRAVADYLQQTAAIQLPGGDTPYDVIAQQALASDDTSEQSQLLELQGEFADSIASFKKVPTPPEAVALQHGYVGSTMMLAQMFRDLQNARSNPVQITLNQSAGVWLVDYITQLNVQRDALAKSIEGK